MPNGHAFREPHFLADRRPFEIGPFRITPFRLDHSAFDAHALMVEADGERVLYSGDFRAHGRKAAVFERLVGNPPADIDALLIEGTTLGATAMAEGFETEADAEMRFVEVFHRSKDLRFVWTFAQNIDRIVTIFRAAKRTGRLLWNSGGPRKKRRGKAVAGTTRPWRHSRPRSRGPRQTPRRGRRDAPQTGQDA